MAADRPTGKTLAGDAYERIRGAIQDGRLRPGDRLRFADLQALCAMSVTPVREALARLTAEGFTVLDDHRGFSVAPLSLSELRDITANRKLCDAMARRSFKVEAKVSTVVSFGDKVGKTYNDRDIWALKVNKDAKTSPDHSRPAVLYYAIQHAR